MPIGLLQVHVYTSIAQLPLKDAAIIVTSKDHTALAMRITDRSGLTEPIEIPVPERSESQSPGAEGLPYTLVNLIAKKRGYEQIISEDIQIFDGVTTYQDLEMIPLAEYPLPEHTEHYYDTPPQDL